MAAQTFENSNLALVRRKVDWAAIWAGVFTFAAIWSVFGLLGVAIFSSAANPSAARPVSGMNVGIAIWAIVLTIIAMYVAGRETGRLAAVATRHDGLIHGMAMFGLSVVAVIVMLGIAGMGTTAGATSVVHNPYMMNVISSTGWAGFLSLLLGWLAAMGGASSGVGHKTDVQTPVQSIRNAAA
jgi:hypothetical protein